MSIMQCCAGLVGRSIRACRRVARDVALHQARRVARLSAATLAVSLGVGVAPATGQTSQTFYEPNSWGLFDSTTGAFGSRCDLNIGGPGNCVFWGGASAFSSSMEEYRISDNNSDCGASTFSALAQIGGWQSQGDYAIVYFRFLDINRNQTGLVQLGPVTPAERGNQTRLLWRSASGVVPAGTVYVRLEMEMHRVSGQNNDGYIGDTEITITTPRIAISDAQVGAIRTSRVGGIVELSVVQSWSGTTPAISWQSPRRGTLQDGTYPDGLIVSGATTHNLTLANVQPQDDGLYSARVTCASLAVSFPVSVNCSSGPLPLVGSAISAPPIRQQGSLRGVSIQGDSAMAVVAEDAAETVLNLSHFRRRTDAFGLSTWVLDAQRSFVVNGPASTVLVHGSTVAVDSTPPGSMVTTMYGLTPLGTLDLLGFAFWPTPPNSPSPYQITALGDGVLAASSRANIAIARRDFYGWVVTDTLVASDLLLGATSGSVEQILDGAMVIRVSGAFQGGDRRFIVTRDEAGRWSGGLRAELPGLLTTLLRGTAPIEILSDDRVWSLGPSGWIDDGLIPRSSAWGGTGQEHVRAGQSLASWTWRSAFATPHLLRHTRTPTGWRLVGINPFGLPWVTRNLWQDYALDRHTIAQFVRNDNRSVSFGAFEHTDRLGSAQLPEFIPESQTGVPGLSLVRYVTFDPVPANFIWRFRGQTITGPTLPPPFDHVAATPGFDATSAWLSLQTNGTPISAGDITLAILDPCSTALIEHPCAISELEPNDFLDAPALDLRSGQSIIGTSHGALADGSVLSRDYLGIRAEPAPASGFRPGAPMITKHRFSVRARKPGLFGQPSFSVDLRGHPVSDGQINTAVASPIQTDTPQPGIDRLIDTLQWYGLGPDPTRMDVRIAAKPGSPQGSYIGTLISEPVQTAVIPGNISAGPVTFTTNLPDQFADTELWLYDSNLRPIPGAGNDDTPIEPDVGNASATLTADLAPGRYILAMSLYPFSNPEPSPASDANPSGSVTATPNVAVSAGTTEGADVTLRVLHAGRSSYVVGTIGSASAPPQFDIPTRFLNRFDIHWIELNVGWPFSDCGVADIADTDAVTVLSGGGPDGVIDNGDFTAFFTAFFLDADDPARLVADIADTDANTPPNGYRDGALDNGDFTAFFASFFAGGCENQP